MLPQRKPGFLTPKDRCTICGREAKHTCRNCGKSVCDQHYNFSLSMCYSCATKKNREMLEASTQAKKRELVGNVCAYCTKDAKHTCKECGKHACDEHFDSGLGICVACRIKHAREKMKEDSY